MIYLSNVAECMPRALHNRSGPSDGIVSCPIPIDAKPVQIIRSVRLSAQPLAGL